MKRILVPTDFSTCANNAINFAVQSAKILPAEIFIIHAFEIKENMYTDYLGVNREFTQSQLDEVQYKLSQVKSSIVETEGISVTVMTVKEALTEAILRTTSELKIDMIVMGTLGANMIKEKVLGTKTAEIIGKTKVPVIAIPFEYEWKKPQKFLSLTNHFESDPVVLNFILELAGLYKAKVEVAVFTDTDEEDVSTLLGDTRNIEQYKKMLEEQYKEEAVTATHLFGAEFNRTIQTYIAEKQIDILVMVTHHRALWERILHPSMTKRMSQHIEIPLLAVPALNH